MNEAGLWSWYRHLGLEMYQCLDLGHLRLVPKTVQYVFLTKCWRSK